MNVTPGRTGGHLNIYYGLQWIEDILCSYTSSTYCHKSSALKQAEASEPNAFYKHYIQDVGGLLGVGGGGSAVSLGVSLYKHQTTYTNL